MSYTPTAPLGLQVAWSGVEELSAGEEHLPRGGRESDKGPEKEEDFGSSSERVGSFRCRLVSAKYHGGLG